MLVSPKKSTKSAFTLIELLVSLAIFGLLTVTIAQFLTSFLSLKFNAEMRQRMRQEGTNALDRIEFLVRNGATVPNVCAPFIDPNACTDDNRAFLQLADDSPCPRNINEQSPPDTLLPIKADRLMVNTFTTGNYVSYQRYQAWYDTSSGVNNTLYIAPPMQNADSGCSLHTVDRNNPDPNSCFNNNKRALISTSEGSSGTSGLTVSKIASQSIFTCRRDEWTGGIIVTVGFQIKYHRQTMYGNDPELVETFRREVAIRNLNKFEL